jgi:poly(A) polymerase
MLIPEQQRRFAVEVVRRLRGAGFEAYWAGGCVRDQLLGRTPKDYDVATSATPEQVRSLFGRRRTLAIGAAFGVIAVLGPKAAGTVEVTTFRRDALYSDGRHPDSVTFSSAEEDASRRDFTINGLFYDPVEQRVIDFVSGQDDLAARRIRAIGRARDRFAEDKLRMLRAVRFAAGFDFVLDDEARRAIAEMAAEIHLVSPERIAMEMRRMLADPGRENAVRLLVETGLARELLPEIVAGREPPAPELDETLKLLSRLGTECGFPLALAALLESFVDAQAAAAVCQRWRLSNKEAERVCWLVEYASAMEGAQTSRWSLLQPLLIAEGIGDLLKLAEARSPAGAETAAYVRARLAQPRDVLDPSPLLTGNDLLARGVPAGPEYRTLLQRVRAAQLDGEVHTKDEALAMVDKWRGGGD